MSKHSKLTLEQALKELGHIVEELNEKDLHVEEGMKQFEKGVFLIQFCRRELKTAENKFKLLKKELEEESEEDI